MKKVGISIALFAGPLGCRTSSDAAGVKSDESGANWQRVISCSGGDAVVEVDQNERRSFQLVIKNPLVFSTFDQWTYGQIQTDRERIYRGKSIDGRGVFQASDFIGFFANGVSADRRGFKVKRGTSDSGHGGPSTDLTFTAVDLSLCGGDLRDNDFPDSCRVGSYQFTLCHLYK